MAPMASDLKRIQQSSTNTSFRTAYMKPGHEEQEAQTPVQTLEHALAIDDDGPPPPRHWKTLLHFHQPDPGRNFLHQRNFA